MKNLITFLLSCLSVTALLAQVQSETRLEVLSASITETTLRLDVTGVDRVTVNTAKGPADALSIQQGTPMLQKGAPDLPKYSTALLIPGKGNMAVEVVSSAYEEFTDMEIAPSKGDLKRTVNPDTVPYEYGPAYARDQFFPGALAALQTPFVFRAARGQALWIYPVQYNPVQKTLRVYHSITLRVYYTGGTGKNELPAGASPAASRSFDQLYQRLFVNATTQATDRSGAQEPEKMLVIAADQLLDELQPLVAWKRQMGIHTTVVPVSEIGSSESGEIYNFVKDYYATHGISYLLLAGDEAAIRPEMRDDGGSYSCDNCFGYMSGDDHFPEILVGRLHASTPEQMRIMVNRNLEYEIQPLVDSTQNWLATGMASTSDEGAGIGDDGQADWQQGNEWKSAHLADGYEQYWEFYDGSHAGDSPTPGDITADETGNPTNGPLVNLMNTRGVSLYNYTGHGWEQGLVSGNFNTTAVGNLRNSGRYPILIAVACCAGNFTNGECLGEALQRAGNPATGESWGGIAGFFSSDYQSWSPPMEGQDGMNQYLTDADGINLTPTMAGMLAYGNAKMIAAYGTGGEVMADFWNPFAEPSTMPRTRIPEALTATHTDSIAFETLSLDVKCPVEGALVSLFWQDQTWAVATVVNGTATLEFAPLNNTGNLIVTVTQFNYTPYQGKIAVKPASQPFVVKQQSILLDNTGNGNNRADFGETVALQSLFQNIGLGTATDVTATVSTTNSFVNLSGNTVSLGNLSSSDSAIAVFTFTVRDDVPNGTKADFLLHLSYSDTLSYNTTLTIPLYAPALEVGAWLIEDFFVGNGNQQLESGETATIQITNRNTGGSDAPDALGTLLSLSPYLTVSNPIALGQLDALSGEKSSTFFVSVSPNAPQGAAAYLRYTVKSGNYSAVKLIGPLILNPIIETFESNNFNSFAWQMSGNKPWVTTTASPYAGQYCSRSGTITHNQSSTMQLHLQVLEDGTVSFARRVSSEADYDYLRFYIDDVEMGAWSGNLPWSVVSYPVSEGAHTLTWTYQKDDFVSEGTDRAWVDDVVLPPHQIVVNTHAAVLEDLYVSATPNPTDGPLQLRLELPREQTVRIRVYNSQGRLLQTMQSPAPTPAGTSFYRLDLRGNAPGLYLLEVQGENYCKMIKVVVSG